MLLLRKNLAAFSLFKQHSLHNPPTENTCLSYLERIYALMFNLIANWIGADMEPKTCGEDSLPLAAGSPVQIAFA